MFKKKILITGTTSGIGKELTNFYLDLNYNIIGIDRNINNNFNKYEKYKQHIIDICDFAKVDNLIKELILQDNVPEIFILNAGINIYDNKEYFDIKNFKKCFDINFYGTFNFISSIEKNNLKNKKILLISSTSSMIPNPKALGYFSSKMLLKKLSPFLNKKNIYKVAILGPIKTNISRELNYPTGVASLIYKILIVDTTLLTKKLDKFLNNKKKILYFTKKSFFIYYMIKIILIFLPFLYKG